MKIYNMEEIKKIDNLMNIVQIASRIENMTPEKANELLEEMNYIKIKGEEVVITNKAKKVGFAAGYSFDKLQGDDTETYYFYTILWKEEVIEKIKKYLETKSKKECEVSRI